MKRITLEEAVDLLASDAMNIQIHINDHWTYGKSASGCYMSYWCCDPGENCGSDDYESFDTVQKCIDDIKEMWGRSRSECLAIYLG